MQEKPILVLGATGYIGGRLVPRLLEAGYTVRAVSRSVQKLESRPWAKHSNLQIVAADVLNAESLYQALEGCDVAYYLVHSMNPGQKDFAETDRNAAKAMADASERAGLSRIIYLSGLGEETSGLSKHLQSRTEVGKLLQESSVPITILRAAMIIGSGSASFEILRYLVERLPAMITPRWVSTSSQPIAVRNVLAYLLGCLKHPETTGRVFDIGGPDVLTYQQLMEIYAEEAQLPKRWIIPVPVYTPKLSSYWIHLVTPVPAAIARPLAEGLKNPTVCQENTIREIIPMSLLSCREAIQEALKRFHNQTVETHWTDAGFLLPVEAVYPGDPNWSGGALYRDRRQIRVEVGRQALWETVVRIGGSTGWYYGDWLWHLRGLMDRLVGGVGDRRGRRDASHLMPGDALDFWRVLAVTPPNHLKLLAEMKLPGTAILDFALEADGENQTRLIQTAWYYPRGLSGVLYWYSVMPLHNLVFNGMLRGIAKANGNTILSEPEKISGNINDDPKTEKARATATAGKAS